MASIQLIINDEELDLNDGEKIPLTFQTQNISNITEARGNFSRSFDIPRTDKNNRLLETSYAWNNFGSLPYRKIDAILKVDGQELPKGFVIVENDGLSEKQIKLTYYSGNSNFFQIINQLKLKDCNFGNASHLWNDTTIFDSRNNPYFVYPLIEYTNEELNRYFSNVANVWDSEIEYKYPDFITYGNQIYLSLSESSTNERPDLFPGEWLGIADVQRRIVASRMLPALYASTYKEAIEKTTGYRMQGRIFTLPIWNNLIFPFSLSKLQRQKKDAEARINIDMSAWIGMQLSANTTHVLPLLDSFNTFTKYGNDNFVPYIDSPPTPTNLQNNTEGHVFFPDYTISKFEFKARFSVGTSNNIKFIIATEKIAGDPINTPTFNVDIGNTIIPGTIQGLLRNSVTGATIPLTLLATPQNMVLERIGVPVSFNANPALNFDWIAEIEFKFLTGLQTSVGMRFRGTFQNYFYETSTKIRFESHVEHDDLINYNHGQVPAWYSGVTYTGKNKVYVRHQIGAVIYVFRLNADSSLNDTPSLSSTVWESTTPVGISGFNQWPLYVEASESDYYTVQYGGEQNESSLITNQWHPQYSWITGTDLVPDITVATWLKNVANMFGCLLSVDEDRRIVTWKMWSEIYEDTTIAEDWSNIFVNPLKAIWNPRPSSVGINSYFKYSENDELPLDFASYTVIVDDETLPTEANIYQLYFGATGTKPKFRNTVNAPYIPVFDEAGKIGGKGLQRVLLLNQLAIDPDAATDPILIQLRTGGTLSMTTDIPYCYFNDVTKSEQLGWDVHLYQEFHRWLGYIWNRYRILNCEIILTASDIAKLNLLVPVYIEYYQTYFLILKIQDWIPGKPCKVQLLKLN